MTADDVSYLRLCRDHLPSTLLDKLPSPDCQELEPSVKRRLALTSHDLEVGQDDSTDGGNLIDVLINSIGETRVKVDQVVCDGKILATLVVDDKHIVEVLDDELTTYLADQGTRVKERVRGRVAT